MTCEPQEVVNLLRQELKISYYTNVDVDYYKEEKHEFRILNQFSRSNLFCNKKDPCNFISKLLLIYLKVLKFNSFNFQINKKFTFVSKS